MLGTQYRISKQSEDEKIVYSFERVTAVDKVTLTWGNRRVS